MKYVTMPRLKLERLRKGSYIVRRSDVTSTGKFLPGASIYLVSAVNPKNPNLAICAVQNCGDTLAPKTADMVSLEVRHGEWIELVEFKTS